MSTTVADIQTDLAYRFGEDSAPSNAAESARRLSFISKGYLEIFKRDVFWWSEYTGSPILAVEGQETYDLPSDFRIMVELRVNGVLYTPLPQSEAMGGYSSPLDVFSLPYGQTNNHYWIYAGKLHIAPRTSANAAALSVTSITRSGQVATVTCVGHGFTTEDVITMAGSVETEYNGNFSITVVDADTFTYVVTGSPTTPGTGTPTALKKAITLKYYRKGVKLTADADTLIIPDEYSSAVDAFAYGRICQIDDERGSAADGFAEFDDVIKQMRMEQNNVDFLGQSARPSSPDSVQE